MKTILICLLLVLNFSVYPTTVNGRFIVYNYSDTSAGIKLQINTDLENSNLGGATFIINFDTASLSFGLPGENYNYTFHNFSGGNYEKAFLTKVSSNQLWVNIESLSDSTESDGGGITGWTDVVTIYFQKKNGKKTFWAEADKNSLYWGIFDWDNETMWSAGDFSLENILTEKEELSAPGCFELFQNYPNPFNPSTKINFMLKSEGNAKLIIYDLLGNEVLKLINKDLPAGKYEADVDGKNLSSGVYIYALNVKGKYSAVKKMILLK